MRSRIGLTLIILQVILLSLCSFKHHYFFLSTQRRTLIFWKLCFSGFFSARGWTSSAITYWQWTKCQNILWAMLSLISHLFITSIQPSPFLVSAFSSYAFPFLSCLDIHIYHVLWFWYNLKSYCCSCIYFVLCFIPVLKIMTLFVCAFAIACFRNFNKFWSPIQY